MSEFFNVSTSAAIMLDDSVVSLSSGWSSQHIVDEFNEVLEVVATKEELTAAKTELSNQISHLETIVGEGGGSGLEYKEVIFTIHLDANETRNYDYLLAYNTFLITNIYFESSGANFSFQINNKQTNGFSVYLIESISNYMDSLFLTYNDNDFENKLRTILTNKSNFPTDVTVSIFGMALKNS